MDLPVFLRDTLLAFAWITLLGAPIAGLLRRKRRPLGRDAALLLVMFTALIPALSLSGISTVNQTLNLAFMFAAYAGYCLLAAYSLAIRQRALRLVVTGLAYLPIAAAYLFATIGALALLLLLAASYPVARQTMRPGLSCEIRPGVTAGYEVNLYRYWGSLPWLRRLVHSTSVTVPPGTFVPLPGCAEVLQQYDHKG